MTDEQIIARRITFDEFINYMDKIEYINGRIVTRSGIELFVGVKEFPESIRALEEERERKRMLKRRWQVTDEQKAEEAATEAETEQEGESFRERVMSLLAERNEKLRGLLIPRDAAMVCTLGCQKLIFEGSEKCPRCGHQALPYREFEAMVFGDAEIDPYPVSIRGKEFNLVIHQDVAMVCTRLGCQDIFEGSEKCPRCGHQALAVRGIKSKVLEAVAAEIDPDPVSIPKVLTSRIQ